MKIIIYSLLFVFLLGGKEMDIKIFSSAFEHEGFIPTKYTCDGENISPALSWKNIPSGTKSIAIINDDPDAPMGTWVHWVIYNISATATGLPENIKPMEKLSDGTLQGRNSWGKIGYGGPCPPSGVHRYFFKIYALDVVLDLKPGASKEELLKAMKGHILAEGQFYGKYSRKR
ncbi:MAG: YbhB/YbcL family Raf kinase inhibitor-like protein [Ignavibacteria bacterium]|nr:YbhB/YbcL family Raf kinase inhibitor-like protein [Ignavibacteria bacterium]